MSSKKEKPQKQKLFWPGRQITSADSGKEPIFPVRGADCDRIAPDEPGRMFAEGLISLAVEHPEVAARIYMSDYAAIKIDGSVVFEDDDTVLPIKTQVPRNRFGRFG